MTKVKVSRGRTILEIDSANIDEARARGYEPVDDSAAKRLVDVSDAATAVGGTIGAAEAAASGLTLGISDVVARELGADPARMAARREGLGSKAFELAGAVAPALISGGTSSAATAARLTPAGLTARAGGATAAALERGVGGKLLASTAQAGLEGALAGAGAAASQDALQDRDLSVERMLGGAGEGLSMGALLGAGLYAGGATVGQAMRGTYKLGKGAVNKVVGLADDVPGGGLLERLQHAQISAMGGTVDDMAAASHLTGLAKTAQGRRMMADSSTARAIPEKVGRRFRRHIGSTRVDDAARAWERRFAKQAKAGQRGAQKTRDQLDDWIRRAEKDPASVGLLEPVSKQAASQVRRVLRSRQGDLVASPAAAHRWMSRTADDLGSLVDDLRSRGAADADSLAQMLALVRSMADDGAVWGAMGQDGRALYRAQAAEAAALKDLPPRLRRALAGEMDDTTARQLAARPEAIERVLKARNDVAEVVGKHGGDVEAIKQGIDEVRQALRYGDDLGAANQAQARLRALESGPRGHLARQGLESIASLAGGAIGGLPGAFAGRIIGEGAGVLARPLAQVRGFARMRQVLDLFAGREQAVAKAVGGMAKKGGKAVRRGVRTVATKSVPRGKQRRAQLLKTRQKVLRMAEDPVSMADDLDQGMFDLEQLDPDFAHSLAAHASMAVQFLRSRAPNVYKPPGSDREIVLREDLDQWERYVSAVSDPLSAVESVVSGGWSFEAAETLKSVYPKMFAKLQDEVMAEVGDGEMSFQARSRLGLLLEMPLNAQLQPGFLSSLNVAPPPEEPPLQPTKGSPKAIQVTGVQTAMQRIEEGGRA